MTVLNIIQYAFFIKQRLALQAEIKQFHRLADKTIKGVKDLCAIQERVKIQLADL